MDTDEFLNPIVEIAKSVKRVSRKTRRAAVIAKLQRADLWHHSDADASEAHNKRSAGLNSSMVELTLLLARNTGAVGVLRAYENARASYEVHGQIRREHYRRAAGG